MAGQPIGMDRDNNAILFGDDTVGDAEGFVQWDTNPSE
jgi:hypothetical protein